MRLEPSSLKPPPPTQELSGVVGTEKSRGEHLLSPMLKKYSRQNFRLGHVLKEC